MSVKSSKAEKEAFYQGHTGASHLEVACLVLCSPLFLIAGEIFKIWLPSAAKPWAVGLVELVSHVLPLVAVSMGLLAPIPSAAVLALALLFAAAFRLHQHVDKSASYVVSGGKNAALGSNSEAVQLCAALQNLVATRKRYISVFRGSLMLGTCVAILAVDFKAFPRRYAKTEVVGTGLMDYGVGGIVLAGGLVGPLACAPISGASRPAGYTAVVQRVRYGVWAAAPSLVLWAGRLLSVKAVDYQEHVGEYGVHWNFFATIAGVALANHVFVGKGLSSYKLLMLALAVTLGHQAALTWGGLGPWVSSPHRDPFSWLSLNKEGVGSLSGYWALSLWGALLARALHASLEAPCGAAVALLLGKAESGVNGSRDGCAARGDGAQPSTSCPTCAEGNQDQTEHHTQRSLQADPNAIAGIAAGYDIGASDISLESSHSSCTYTLWFCLQPLAWPLAGWLAVDALLWVSLAYVEHMEYARSTQQDGLELGHSGQLMALAAHLLGGRVSRRSANLAYLVWLLALTLLFLLVLVCAAVLLPRGLSPTLSLAAARHMLPSFLGANLLTGAVNIQIDTLAMGDWLARGCVVVYTVLFCFPLLFCLK